MSITNKTTVQKEVKAYYIQVNHSPAPGFIPKLAISERGLHISQNKGLPELRNSLSRLTELAKQIDNSPHDTLKLNQLSTILNYPLRHYYVISKKDKTNPKGEETGEITKQEERKIQSSGSSRNNDKSTNHAYMQKYQFRSRSHQTRLLGSRYYKSRIILLSGAVLGAIVLVFFFSLIKA